MLKDAVLAPQASPSSYLRGIFPLTPICTASLSSICDLLYRYMGINYIVIIVLCAEVKVADRDETPGIGFQSARPDTT